MKRIIYLLFSTIVSVTTFSGEKKVYTEPEKAEFREKRLQKTGGIIYKAGTGKVLVVNAQQKFPREDIERALVVFRDFLKVNIEIRDGTWKMGDKIPVDAKIAMYIVDDAALPMSLLAMEDSWGVMNVSQLFGQKQFEVEFARVGIATFGGCVSQYKVSPMQPILKPADLESVVKPVITLDAGMSMNANLEKHGITKNSMTTYRRACIEGWAPTPTNEYQKAVWKDVHTLPTEPITIEPETK